MGNDQEEGGSRPSAEAQLTASNHGPPTANSSSLLNRHSHGLKQAAQLLAVFRPLAALPALRLTWLLHAVNQIRKAAGLVASPLRAAR